MHLVVARLHITGAVDDEAAVGDLSIVDENAERPEMNPDVMLAGGLAAGGEHRIVGFGAQVR
jgi:hypothetical protein